MIKPFEVSCRKRRSFGGDWRERGCLSCGAYGGDLERVIEENLEGKIQGR
jgi:hypothetical protein